MRETRVLVVGTTADYVEAIARRHSRRTLFITDPAERAAWPPGRRPGESAEVLCNLEDFPGVLQKVKKHMERFGQIPSGVACYDCESLMLASFLARSLDLPFPSAESVALCRSKYESHRAWAQAGVPCPESILVQTREQAAATLARLGGQAVIKPLSGSGSELVFLCRSESECMAAFDEMTRRLSAHANARMYASTESADPKTQFQMEAYIKGVEYSCDFIIDKGRLSILRLARKIPADNQPFGTILAYVLPAAMPPVDVAATLLDAAGALGLTRAFCMVDFVVRGEEIFLLEMTPRPGGDCLPDLMLTSSGFDSLSALIDFAEGKVVRTPPVEDWQRLVGVRFIATQAGIVTNYDDSELRQDPFVLEVRLKHPRGHRVVLPPEDYDSRILGHAIFDPSGDESIEVEAPEIASKLRVEYKN